MSPPVLGVAIFFFYTIRIAHSGGFLLLYPYKTPHYWNAPIVELLHKYRSFKNNSPEKEKLFGEIMGFMVGYGEVEEFLELMVEHGSIDEMEMIEDFVEEMQQLFLEEMKENPLMRFEIEQMTKEEDEAWRLMMEQEKLQREKEELRKKEERLEKKQQEIEERNKKLGNEQLDFSDFL